MSHYTMLSIYGQCTRQLKIGRASWDFFSRRIEWRPKKVVFIRRILENTISSGKKKPQEFVWKFIEKHMKIHETKIRRPATKEDKYMFNSWKYMKLKYVDQLQKKTSICFFMIAKPLADR